MKKLKKGRENIRNARINDYRRHLGSKYDVIVIGCSAGGKTENGENISTVMADDHDTMTHAASFPITSSFTFSKQGTVEFGSSPKFGIKPTEATLFDGRSRNGVDIKKPLRTYLREIRESAKRIFTGRTY